MGDVEELIGRLQRRVRDWDAQVDGWLKQAEEAGQKADAKTERIMRDTIYSEAADALTALQARLAAVEAERDAAWEALADVGDRIELASGWYHNTQEWHDDDSLPSHIADGEEATVGTLWDWVMEPTTRTLKGTDHG